MAGRSPEALTKAALGALRKTGRRGLLMTGWGGLSQADLPDTVFKLDAAPHSWLFPRMSAIVHHGGAGTTAAALRSGKPSVVIPFFGDQPFWADQVARLKVGYTLQRDSLTADALANALTAADAPDVRGRAAALGARIDAENGVERAASLMTQLFPDKRVLSFTP
jgi:UDP:flavonoid glycosyltransferase YjiC (YdhE family)